MPLVLTLYKPRDPSDRQRESRTLDEGTLSIGRGPGNNWMLQDPAQHLSKTHCLVKSRPGGGYLLIDQSSNGVLLSCCCNDTPTMTAASTKRIVRSIELKFLLMIDTALSG